MYIIWGAILVAIIIVLMCILCNSRAKGNETSNTLSEIETKNLNVKEVNLPNIEILEIDYMPTGEKVEGEELKKNIHILEKGMTASNVYRNLKVVTDKRLKGKKVFVADAEDTIGMMKSKTKKNVFYTPRHGKDGKITKHTELVPRDDYIKSVKTNALINSGMVVASQVVSQYYLEEINKKLSDLQNEVSQINEKLERQYKSKIINICDEILRITTFKDEIINSKLSLFEVNHLKELEDECSKLMSDVLLETNDILQKNINDYDEYINSVDRICELDKKGTYIKRLYEEIEKLSFVIAQGEKTYENAFFSYNKMISRLNDCTEKIKKWHIENINKFKMDVIKERRKGKFHKVKKVTIGLIKEEWAYNKIEDKVANKIKGQLDAPRLEQSKNPQVIRLQKYNGEYYKS